MSRGTWQEGILPYYLLDFKSVPENYEKEKGGRKPNTVRKVSPDDPRYPVLLALAYQGTPKQPPHIRIKQTATGETFERIITDVTFWDGQFIISWKHEED